MVGKRAGFILSQNRHQREGVRIFTKGIEWLIWRTSKGYEWHLSLSAALPLAITEVIVLGLKWGTKVSPDTSPSLIKAT